MKYNKGYNHKKALVKWKTGDKNKTNIYCGENIVVINVLSLLPPGIISYQLLL